MLCERCEAEIDRLGKLVIRPDIPALTRNERRVFSILWDRRGHRISREGILALLYEGKPDPPGYNVIEVYMSRLRRRLPLGLTIHTERAETVFYTLHDRSLTSHPAVAPRWMADSA